MENLEIKFLKLLEEPINRGSMPQFIATGFVIKGVLDRVNQYRFKVYPNEHNPVHFHIESKDRSIQAKYSVEPFQCISGGNERLNKFVRTWFNNPHNKKLVSDEWKRFQLNK